MAFGADGRVVLRARLSFGYCFCEGLLIEVVS